jgi:hypothetical protein
MSKSKSGLLGACFCEVFFLTIATTEEGKLGQTLQSLSISLLDEFSKLR